MTSDYKKLFTRDIFIQVDSIEKNYWKDVWNYRELFYILSWRDVKVRYKQTFVGIGWSLLRPLLTTIIFYLVFNRVAGMNAPNNIPYTLMVFAGMIPWHFFSNSLSEGSNSLISNSNLVSKVYFPRIILPASSLITGLVDMILSIFMICCLFIIMKFTPPIQFFILPGAILFAVFSSSGITILLAAINIKYRDFRYIIPFIVQFGLYITPVGFSSENINGNWIFIYYLNPIAGVVDLFRWCMLDLPVNIYGLLFSFLISIILFFFGVKYFRKTEKYFADNI